MVPYRDVGDLAESSDPGSAECDWTGVMVEDDGTGSNSGRLAVRDDECTVEARAEGSDTSELEPAWVAGASTDASAPSSSAPGTGIMLDRKLLAILAPTTAFFAFLDSGIRSTLFPTTMTQNSGSSPSAIGTLTRN